MWYQVDPTHSRCILLPKVLGISISVHHGRYLPNNPYVERRFILKYGWQLKCWKTVDVERRLMLKPVEQFFSNLTIILKEYDIMVPYLFIYTVGVDRCITQIDKVRYLVIFWRYLPVPLLQDPQDCPAAQAQGKWWSRSCFGWGGIHYYSE